MTEHQRARRARKSKVHFAKLAERAALQGNTAERDRLIAWTLRKRTVQRITESILRLDAATGAAQALRGAA